MFKDHYVAVSAMMDNVNVAVNENGKKIVPKGTLVGGASASVYADRSQKLRVVRDIAALTTAMTGDNNDISLTARAEGADGAHISIKLTDPSGNNKTISVAVSGDDIEVSLATGSGGAITTTASELVAAINSSAEASAIVIASLAASNSGAGAVTALAKTQLANGTLSGASVIDGVLLNDADVTYGPVVCPLLIHGFVKTDSLPVAPTSAQKSAFSSNMQIAFIEH